MIIMKKAQILDIVAIYWVIFLQNDLIYYKIIKFIFTFNNLSFYN